MAQVVVVGGGFAGLSAAARLAKLRHDVTLVESSARLGGRLRGVAVDGVDGPRHLDDQSVTLPGVFRDLFRKSGRTMDRSLDMTLTSGRRHLFPLGTVLDLPFRDRAEQIDAVAAATDGEIAEEWADWIDHWNEPWDALRRTLLDRVPDGSNDLDRAARRLLHVRRSVGRTAERTLDDDRLIAMVLSPMQLDGHDRRTAPTFLAVTHYLERTFGRWSFAGGHDGLADALEQRLAERRVTVALDETAHELAFTGTGTDRRVSSVVTDRRSLDSDVVVWCAATRPAPLPAVRNLPLIPASRTVITLGPDAPDLPPDVLGHTRPAVRLVADGEGPDGRTRWTVVHFGDEDPFRALARVGLDLRDHVEEQHSLKPADLVRLGHWGWRWMGWRSIDLHPGVSPAAGLHFAGAHAWSGGTLEQIGMATAAIAESVGPAPR